MRIAIVTISRRQLGGTEEYLARLIPELVRRGHDVALSYQTDAHESQALISLPPSVHTWNHTTLGSDSAIDILRAWRPDVIYCNGISDPTLGKSLPTVCPTVFSVHTYWGTCVSGAKSFQTPTPRPCHRTFGPSCLALYYPRRCGGLSPVTMLRDYSSQSQHLRALRGYAAIVVHSEHMLRECAQHGLHAEKIYLPLGATESRPTREPRGWPQGRPWRLLFLGRMTNLKGASLLLQALHLAQPRLGARIDVTLAGDGPERQDLELRAMRLSAALPGVNCRFTGWVSGVARADALASTDLLVVPSVFPEPFGMVGLEAAEYGVPAAGFAVGGIPDWLREGVNGSLAPGDPPTPVGLAEAILRTLGDESRYQTLSAGAIAVREEFARVDTAAELLRVFKRVCTPLSR